ncbi:MAG: universal stress protein [Cyanobacteria bacterium SBLK]|nr:universal stress protein [Cyanobacteria bacterium SBLK]
MFQNCLICTDFSDGLHRLIGFVPSLAAGGLKRIIFSHSVPIKEEGSIPKIDKEKVKEAEAQLAPCLIGVPSEVEVKIEVPIGRPKDTIPKLVEAYDIDVIFTGMPTRNALEETLFGSTTQEMSKVTDIPLMILRPQLISTYTREELALRCQHLWRYLLIPYNDGKTAKYLIERVKSYARKNLPAAPRQCMLLWVVNEGARRGLPENYHIEEAKQKLEAVKADLETVGLDVNVEVRSGNPLHELLDAALNFDISAIATSHLSRSALLEFTAPSFANEILRHSWFPVLFFSPKK